MSPPPGLRTAPFDCFAASARSSFRPQRKSGELSYAATIHSLAAEKKIAIEPSTEWQAVSGDITASTDWGSNARIRVTGDLRVAPEATLTIGSGSVILVDPDVDIRVEGGIVVEWVIGASPSSSPVRTERSPGADSSSMRPLHAANSQARSSPAAARMTTGSTTTPVTATATATSSPCCTWAMEPGQP